MHTISQCGGRSISSCLFWFQRQARLMLKCTLAWMWASPASSEDRSCTLTHTTAQHVSCLNVWETTALGRSPWALSLAGDTAHFLCSQEQLLSVYGLHVQNCLLHFSFVIQENGLFSRLAVVGHLWLPGMLLGTAQQVMQKVLAGGFEVICILLMFPQAAVFYWHEPWFSCLNWISLLRSSLLTIFLLPSPVFTCHMHTCAKKPIIGWVYTEVEQTRNGCATCFTTTKYRPGSRTRVSVTADRAGPRLFPMSSPWILTFVAT